MRFTRQRKMKYIAPQEKFNRSIMQPTPQFKWLDYAADFMDSKYRIPFTKVRFGADFIVGLIPYGGDLLTFGFSGFLVVVMAKHGVSGRVVSKMLGNILLDTAIGIIPIAGDLFDLGYKSNQRNLKLLKAHYQEGKHQGSAWRAILIVLLVLGSILLVTGWLIWKLLSAVNAIVFG
jgi:hypothetical protein